MEQIPQQALDAYRRSVERAASVEAEAMQLAQNAVLLRGRAQGIREEAERTLEETCGLGKADAVDLALGVIIRAEVPNAPGV